MEVVGVEEENMGEWLSFFFFLFGGGDREINGG
jgi:hypothetical protein